MYTAKTEVKELIDDSLNRLLYDLDTAMCDMSYADAIHWIVTVETKIRQLERFAVTEAVKDGITKIEIAEAMGTTRQTLENRWGEAIKKERGADARRARTFTKVTDYAFVNGELKPQEENISEEDYTPEQAAFRKNMRQALRSHPDAYESITEKALEANVIPPRDVMHDRKIMAFIQGDTDIFLATKIPAKERDWWVEAAKFSLDWPISDEELEKYDGRYQTRKAQTSVLPKPILPEWHKYQQETEHPTFTEFAKRYGVSRSTVSRAVAREESEQA